MNCGGDGALPRDKVLETLRNSGVSIEEISANTFQLVKNSNLVVQVFGEQVNRKMIGRLAHTFEIQPHLFWKSENPT